MSQNHRLTLLPLAALSLATLMACSATPQASTKVDPITMASFTAAMQSALINRIAAANQGTLVGVVTLKLTLDRNNQPTACKAMRSSPAVQSRLPPLTVTSDFKQLAQLVERQCWQTTYPPVPEGLFENNEVEVIAPLVLMPHVPRSLVRP
ncbi:hypothetical protein [Pseudomonas carassii]|uniref:Lipoprotein n=1 Tax=Pseudomonas carassii TaxID=3115855 RepID=A0ABU7HHX7_9PSED|nr:hypothetical protein [Pseudomonas sp. 137P]MEE1890924.1 hypothetical protein [Pseudomonas sp. 137P]